MQQREYNRGFVQLLTQFVIIQPHYGISPDIFFCDWTPANPQHWVIHPEPRLTEVCLE